MSPSAVRSIRLSTLGFRNRMTDFGRQWGKRRLQRSQGTREDKNNLKHNGLKCKCSVVGWYLFNIDSKDIKLWVK